MKKQLILSSFLAMALVACSSMEVDESDILAENFPEDFSYKEYMELHPALVSMQVQDYVSNANKGLKMDEADSVAFYDSLNLYKIYTNPNYGGYTVDSWKDKWAEVPLQLEVVECHAKLDTVDFRLSYDGKTLTVYPDSIVFDTTGAVAEIYGIDKDSAKVSYVLADSIKIAKVNTKMDTTGCDTSLVDTVVIEGLSPANLKYLGRFNLYNTVDDVKKLDEYLTAKLDTFAIAYQFIVFGRSHAWAYRRCKDSEMSDENFAYTTDIIDSIQTVVYPAQSLYCADEDNKNVYELR